MVFKKNLLMERFSTSGRGANKLWRLVVFHVQFEVFNAGVLLSTYLAVDRFFSYTEKQKVRV
jgi:hypothetical protein